MTVVEASSARSGRRAVARQHLRSISPPQIGIGFALPITRIREYAGFSAAELTDMLGSFHPPQGYTLVARHPAWRVVCEKLTSTDTVREMTVQHPATASTAKG
jgi:hypothetical protein